MFNPGHDTAMDHPSKHHFNPAFSLKLFAGPDGLVCQMRLINGGVIPGRYHPNATGYERDLYKTEGVPGDVKQHLEENFFKPSIRLLLVSCRSSLGSTRPR